MLMGAKFCPRGFQLYLVRSSGPPRCAPPVGVRWAINNRCYSCTAGQCTAVHPGLSPRSGCQGRLQTEHPDWRRRRPLPAAGGKNFALFAPFLTDFPLKIDHFSKVFGPQIPKIFHPDQTLSDGYKQGGVKYKDIG